jgi:hypothetical protein
MIYAWPLLLPLREKIRATRGQGKGPLKNWGAVECPGQSADRPGQVQIIGTCQELLEAGRPVFAWVLIGS